MVPYFLASNLAAQNSKYASWTLMDIVVELSASPRTQARMAETMVANPSGTRGGGIFHDKLCEHAVRSIKTSLRKCHGGLDDLLLEKMLGGLSLINQVCEHDRASMLQDKAGKCHSHNFMGQSVRDILEEHVGHTDPFNKLREPCPAFLNPARSSPYTGLEETQGLVRFMNRAAISYDEKY